jgi:hypothetical protein
MGGFLEWFHEVWLVDFEFQAEPGERPIPVCLVGLEYKSGRKIRLWQDELKPGGNSRFDYPPVTNA